MPPGESVELVASKFNRHTFWCSQSGSVKTHVLLQLQLPLLFLDPNADFDHLNKTLLAPRHRYAHPAFHPRRGDRVRAVNRHPVAARSVVLQLDPVRDAEEFNVPLNFDTGVDATSFDGGKYIASLRVFGDPGQARLAIRTENLQVLN